MAREDPIDLLPDSPISSPGPLGEAFTARGCTTFRAAATLVRAFPYGRTIDRSDYRLVLAEQRGTCSTKHALLAAVAREHGLPVQLMLGIYEMTETNTPGVGGILRRGGLSAIPEALCWLRYQGAEIDLTMPVGGNSPIPHICLHAEPIEPEDIGTYKQDLHRRYLGQWLVGQRRPDLDLDQVWSLREACIAALSSELAPD
jgi:hypothetical protein